MNTGIHLLDRAEYYVAIDNICAWPCLARLPNGDIAAAVYNQPSHGFGCGDVDLWLSADQGRSWQPRGPISDHADSPEQVRMNHALGVNADGELVALVSGWSAGRVAPILAVQICRSADGGRTWQRSLWSGDGADQVPYGPIILQPDGGLTAALYGTVTPRQPGAPAGPHQARLFRSRDGGRTWGDPSGLAAEFGEVALLRLRSGVWLAAGRALQCRHELTLQGTTAAVHLFRSQDEGRNWVPFGPPVSVEGQHPAHLLQLRDERVLLCYGSRITGLYGACARISADEGETWSFPRVLVGAPGPMDGGYPSAVEMDDGTIVTAYYAGPREPGFARKLMPYAMPWHFRYHMGVCRWRPEHAF